MKTKIRDMLFSVALLSGVQSLFGGGGGGDLVLAEAVSIALVAIGAVTLIAGLFSPGGAFGSDPNDKARRDISAREWWVTELSKPYVLEQYIKDFTPAARTATAAGGQAASNAISRSIAKRGLSASPVGTQLQGAAEAIPDMEAAERATTMAENARDTQISAITGLPIIGGTPRRGIDDIQGFVGNLLAMDALKPTSPTLLGTGSPAADPLFPTVTPGTSVG